MWPNGWMDQDGTWHGGGPWSRPHCATWGPSSSSHTGADPQFSVHFYCGQTAGCVKMPLGKEVGLSPGDFVLDGDPAPSTKRGGPRLLWPNGCMDQDVTRYRDRPRPTRHCVIWGLSSPSPKGAQSPNFRSMSVVATELDGLRCHLVWT